MAEKKELICAHCGEICRDDSIRKGELLFCCTGCLFVYEMLKNEDLSDVYELTRNAGVKPKVLKEGEYAFLDDTKVLDKILDFSINGRQKVTLYLPNIYCSACIWLLENLFRLDKGVFESKVNFLKKEISIIFDGNITSLRKIVELLASLGYAPQLNLADLDKKHKKNPLRMLYIRLGVAGFSFGNVMLLAFPEYLSGGVYEEDIRQFISWITLLFAIPVLFAASEYFKSAYKGFKLKHINIDVPLSIGIISLFARSVYDIISNSGPGFMDSMSGLVFFLLIGRVFQQKTYHRLSFERDYKSFFPLTVLRKTDNGQEYVTIKDILPGNKIILRNNELVPADSILLSNNAFIDYSFITGEEHPVEVVKNGKLYSGGRLVGASVEILVMKPFKQSYLTELWNNHQIGGQSDSSLSHLSNTAAKYFTFAILAIASTTLVYWLPHDSTTALNAFTAVLVIACPCALALSIPFTYGTAMRILEKQRFYLKNDKIIEYLSNITDIIFDKTGTLTNVKKSEIDFFGNELSDNEKIYVKSSAKNSTHPVSRLIEDYLNKSNYIEVDEFLETPGSGIEAIVDGKQVRIGNIEWVSAPIANFSKIYNRSEFLKLSREASAFLSIGNEYKGVFVIKSNYRENIDILFKELKKSYKLFVLSGDRDTDKHLIQKMSGPDVDMHFNMLPDEKLKFVNNLQKEGKKCLTIGDGLNDAGALAYSHCGIAITDDSSSFSPGASAILHADSLPLISKFLLLSRSCIKTVKISFIISILYNVVGLFFAVQGLLSPLFAAVLMPISSVSVVLFTVSRVNFSSKLIGLKK